MLYSYKMTHDSGFAPNPFHGILTLATCKPKIRLGKKVGDYIAGFTSSALCGEKIGEERLVYIMKVTEKITYNQYWEDPRFHVKKLSNDSDINRVGDNIYKPIQNLSAFDIDNYTQVKNPYHETKALMEKDLSGQYVLLSNDFFYFGEGAIPVDKFKINIPKFQSGHGIRTDNETEVERLWKYLTDNYAKKIDINKPHHWPPESLDSNCSRSNCETKVSDRNKIC
jgi:hypothetical protein